MCTGVTETLRLWNSVPNGTFRQLQFDDQIRGADGEMVTLPKGTHVPCKLQEAREVLQTANQGINSAAAPPCNGPMASGLGLKPWPIKFVFGGALEGSPLAFSENLLHGKLVDICFGPMRGPSLPDPFFDRRTSKTSN